MHRNTHETYGEGGMIEGMRGVPGTGKNTHRDFPKDSLEHEKRPAVESEMPPPRRRKTCHSIALRSSECTTTHMNID